MEINQSSGDQSVSNDVASIAHCDITMGDDVASNAHCDIIMGNVVT